jgi:hypothetical protein
LLRNYRFLANGASVVEASELSEAMSMNSMPARQILRRLTTAEHVLSTHRTVVLVFITKTIVGVVDMDTNAHAALLAVPKGFDATHTAKATLRTVEGLLRTSHPEVTNATMIFSKRNTALNATVSEESSRNRQCEYREGNNNANDKGRKLTKSADA